MLALAGLLVSATALAANINGSDVSLHLPTTDLSSSSSQISGAGARVVFAATPVGGIVSTSGAGAKIIIEPMNALTANGAIGTSVAEFFADPLVGAAPLEVQFEDLSSGGLYQILSWTWDFGDGSPYSSDQDPSHRYENPGSYTVTLTLMTTGGTVSTIKEAYINVIQQASVLNVAGMLLLVVIVTLTGAMLLGKRRQSIRKKCH